ncbi:hypothetical protein TQ29_05930 [Actibacterium sp. EMB200-NS6]|nr:hypothetical protein TQ29_05930 [Actibacterium sp. EMB200-NS6]
MPHRVADGLLLLPEVPADQNGSALLLPGAVVRKQPGPGRIATQPLRDAAGLLLLPEAFAVQNGSALLLPGAVVRKQPGPGRIATQPLRDAAGFLLLPEAFAEQNGGAFLLPGVAVFCFSDAIILGQAHDGTAVRPRGAGHATTVLPLIPDLT